MRVLVTGGAGFIGSHLCERLLSLGYTVVAVDNFDAFYDPRHKRNNIRSLIDSPSFTLFEGDIRDSEFLEKVFLHNQIEMVFHLAARAGVRPSIAEPELYYDVNVNGTLCLLEAMKNHGVKKMVFAGSSSVYGNNPKTPFAETDNVDNPISPYAASKKAGELLCHTYYHLYDMHIYCMRFFTVYGPRQRPEMAIHLFTQLIMTDKKIRLFGNGHSRRDYTYIDDIIEGLVAIPSVINGFEIINLGNSVTVELNELPGIISRYCSKTPEIEYLPEQAGDVERTWADIHKAEKLLQYKPRVKIAEGLKHFVEWYKKTNLTALDG